MLSKSRFCASLLQEAVRPFPRQRTRSGALRSLDFTSPGGSRTSSDRCGQRTGLRFVRRGERGMAWDKDLCTVRFHGVISRLVMSGFNHEFCEHPDDIAPSRHVGFRTVDFIVSKAENGSVGKPLFRGNAGSVSSSGWVSLHCYSSRDVLRQWRCRRSQAVCCFRAPRILRAAVIVIFCRVDCDQLQQPFPIDGFSHFAVGRRPAGRHGSSLPSASQHNDWQRRD